MNYEIKIISEEDTIKSRTYEDLDKAIEIADKMFNDFVNTDFGDEIVVTEENSKDKKYYWANGKQLITNIKVGDIVKVVNSGYSYSTYEGFMLTYGTKEDCCNWVKYENPQENEDKYEVMCIAPHPTRFEADGEIAIIRALDYHNKTYIIGLKGLQKVWTL